MNPINAKKSTLLVTIMALSLVFLMTVPGCEGPAGPAGADGIDGTDGTDGVAGNVTCLGCHSLENMNENRFAYNSSQHALGEAVDYAGGRSYCARCHSHEGFVEWATTGSVEADISSPTPFTCKTCHGLHTTFDSTDYAFRVEGAVELYYDETQTIDIDEKSNLCSTCHQARKEYTEYDDSTGDSVYVSSTHAGPHHGPQSMVLLGLIGNPNIGSIDITAIGPSSHKDVGCTGCHMYDESTDLTEGGHTFWPALEKCQVCHAGADSYDINGFQTAIADSMTILLGKLQTIGILDSTGSPV